SRSPEASAKRALAVKRQNEALRNWNPSELPEWLTDEVYASQIQPTLHRFSKQQIADALGVNVSFVYKIVNRGEIPHKRHWVKLAELVGVTLRSDELLRCAPVGLFPCSDDLGSLASNSD